MAPLSPTSETRMLVVKADEPILTSVLPSKHAPIIRFRLDRSRLTTAARRSPLFSSACMRARDAAVSAVSEAAKNAEKARQMRMIAIAIHKEIDKNSALWPCMVLVSRVQFVFEERAHLAGVDRLRHETVADTAREDKGERA